MYSESKEPSGQAGAGHQGSFSSAHGIESNISPLCSQLPLSRTAQPQDGLLLYKQNACQLPGAGSQRTAHNSQRLLNLSLFQKNPTNTIMLSNFSDISKLSHSEYFYVFILSLICQKIKKLSEENLYFIILLTRLKARGKPTKKKKKIVVAIWRPIKILLYYINN